MRRGKWERSAIATVAIVVLMAACGSDGGDGGEGDGAAGSPSRAPQETGPVTLKVLAFNDYMPEAIPKQFKELTGNDMEITYTSSNEDAIAKMQAAGPGAYDIAWITSPFTQGLIAADGIEPLDEGAIPNVSNLYPEASELEYDPGNKYSIPYSWGTTGICYRKDLVKNTEIDSWSDLLDPSPELAGKITLIDEDRWILEPALMSLGYSINTTDPEELQAAVDETIAAKDTLLGFDGETFYTKLVSGEALAVQGWDGWCNYGTAEDPNVVYVQPKEGSDLWVDTMVIPKGSTHVQQAQDFINFILEPENQQWVAENILYKVPNQKSMEALDPAFLKQFPNMTMTPQEILSEEPLLDLGDGQTAFSDAVTQVKSG
jgi:spermidine/putrescine transport system substrate-binding protein